MTDRDLSRYRIMASYILICKKSESENGSENAVFVTDET